MIRVQIAAGSAVVRSGLESLVGSSPGMTVTDSYADGVGGDCVGDARAGAGDRAGGRRAWSGTRCVKGEGNTPADASAAEIWRRLRRRRRVWRRSTRVIWRR